MLNRFGVGLILSVVFLFTDSAAHAVDPAVNCKSSKLKVAGKYAQCRLSADSKAAKTGDPVDYSKCESQFSDKWQDAESKAGPGVCPSEGDHTDVQGFLDACDTSVTDALGGGALRLDPIACNADLDTCGNDLATCGTDRDTCNTDLTAAQLCGNGVIDAGEECDQGNLNGGTCATQGLYGDGLACGAGCSFDTSACSTTRYQITPGGLTVIDHQTGLEWQRTDDNGGLTDRDNTYWWSSLDGYDDKNPDGDAFTVFLGTLNKCTSNNGTVTGLGFAGHCDWRIPTIDELKTILLAPYPCPVNPCIDSGVFGIVAFGTRYWSSTSLDDPAHFAWYVNLADGTISVNQKTQASPFTARAVRGAR